MDSERLCVNTPVSRGDGNTHREGKQSKTAESRTFNSPEQTDSKLLLTLGHCKELRHSNKSRRHRKRITVIIW
ncbi:hypothetical protein SRHO_G00119550 [Serrasalmus rhombeus]